MSNGPFAGGIDLTPGPQGPPVPTGGLRLVTIGQALYTSTDGITFTAITSGGGTIQTAAPVSGDGSSGNKVTIAAGALPLTAIATQATVTVLANATGGTASPTAVALDATMAFTGGALAVAVPLTLVSTGGGINKILTLHANVASGDPAISFKSNGTEKGYIRVDSSGAVNIVPIGAGGTTVLWVNGEANWKFAVGVAGVAFFQGTLRGIQAVGAALTDGTSGGTAGTLTAVSGSGDDTHINGNFHQIAIKLAAYETALKSTGINLWSD